MPFPLPALLGAAYALSEASLAVFKRSRDDSVDADGRSLGLLWITSVLAVGAGLAISERVPEASMGGGAAPFWIGTGTFGAGLILRWYSILFLGRYFTLTIAIHSRHEVVDTGPYRHVRHPAYAGALLAFAGLASCLENWVAFAAVMIPTAWAFAQRIRLEEHALASALGTPYVNYMRRTKRLVPFLY
jgi:protein-S-isoprenylcysteine O-methyltransferase Ste14